MDKEIDKDELGCGKSLFDGSFCGKDNVLCITCRLKSIENDFR